MCTKTQKLVHQGMPRGEDSPVLQALSILPSATVEMNPRRTMAGRLLHAVQLVSSIGSHLLWNLIDSEIPLKFPPFRFAKSPWKNQSRSKLCERPTTYYLHNHMSNRLNLLHPRKDVAEMVIVFCVSLIVPEDLMFAIKSGEHVYQESSFFVSPLSFLRVSWWYQVSMSWCNCSKMSEVLAGAHMVPYSQMMPTATNATMGVFTK